MTSNPQEHRQSGSDPITSGSQPPASTTAPAPPAITNNTTPEEMPVLQGPPNRACYKHTCAIQTCLSESNYDTRACTWAIDALKRCCEMKHARGSIHCSFPDLKMVEDKEKEEQAGSEVKDSGDG